MRAFLLALAVLALPPAAAASGFTGLGDLPGEQFESRLAAISGDGQVAVGSSRTFLGGTGGTSSATEAFRWTREGGMVGLGVFAATPPFNKSSFAWGASADGSFVVGAAPFFDALVAFRWSADTGLESLGADFPGGDNATAARAVSADGAVVVGWGSTSNGQVPFRWTTETGLVDLGHLPFPPRNRPSTEALGVSADGEVVVGTSITNPPNQGGVYEAFRWTEATGMVGLGDLPGGRVISRGAAISADRSTIVGSSEGFPPGGSGRAESQMFRWTEATGMVALGGLRERIIGSYPTSVSHDGSRIAGAARAALSSSTHVAVLWDAENGMRDLNELLPEDYGDDLTGWLLTSAVISADGRVVAGTGENPNGDLEAWIATLLVEVELDIRPGTEENRIRPDSRRRLRVAILGSPVLPADEIDPASLRFGPDGATPVRPHRGRLRDVDGDGRDDLVLRFRMQETGIAFGDDEACIAGLSFDGRELAGCDAVDTVSRCGPGYELALLLPVTIAIRARRRRMR